MSAENQVDDLLDAWEDQCEQTRTMSLDQFIDCHRSAVGDECLAEFRKKAEQLAAIDNQLIAMHDVDGCEEFEESGPVPNPDLALNDLRPGLQPIAGYTLVARLGSGGFGEVWNATGPGDFHVALKFVPVESRAGEIEGRSLDVIRGLHHPHLLPIFGTWRIGGLLVIASELADRTLLDRFNEVQKAGQQGLPCDELVRYMEEAAKGIDYLNEPTTPGRERIQHRDIKPQNLLLSGGSVKVGDLGLARFIEFGAATHTDSVTFEFAAPEFFDGATSNQSDQYSLAATYCFLRGGRLPFNGAPVEIMEGHRKRVPDLSMLPPCERPVVARALSKSPKARWSNCAEFVQELRETTRGPDPIKPQRMKWSTTIVAAGVLVVGVIAAGLQFFKPTATTDTKKGNAALVGSETATATAAVMGAVSAALGEPERPITLVVLDFENHSNDSTFDGFRLGFRDMLVTDISRESSIKILERSRLAALLKEHELAKTTFIDAEAAVRLGRGLSAQNMLTGSFVIASDDIRIDVRVSSVETGEVLFADSVRGKRSEIFDLQTALARRVLAGLKISESPLVAQVAPPAMSGWTARRQIRDFEAFRLYGEARLAQIQGKREESELRFREAVARDPGFQLATRELDKLTDQATLRLTQEQERRIAAAGEIGKQFEEHRQLHQTIIEADRRDAQYFASLVILSAYAGLVGDVLAERQLLFHYWDRFTDAIPPDQAFAVGESIRKIIMQEGAFFQERVDSGQYWNPRPTRHAPAGPAKSDKEKDAEKYAPYLAYLKPELRQSFSWPRYSLIWPFNKRMRSSFHQEQIATNSPQQKESWKRSFEMASPKYPHDYLAILLDEINSGEYILTYNDSSDEEIAKHERWNEILRLNISVAHYYDQLDTNPGLLFKETSCFDWEYFEWTMLSKLSETDRINRINLSLHVLKDAVAVLEKRAKTSIDANLRKTADRVLLDVIKELRNRKVDEAGP